MSAPAGREIGVWVGVGSNVRPEIELLAGVAALQTAFDVTCISSVYRSPAFGFDGDDFLNIVIELRTRLDVDAVAARLDAIESDGQRRRLAGRFAPRALDCDLLMFGCRVDAPRRLPRDDILEYPFVLGPLAEIAPQLRHPLDGRSIAAHWRARRGPAQLQRIGTLADLRLPADTAAAVDRQDLAGDVGRVTGEI